MKKICVLQAVQIIFSRLSAQEKPEGHFNNNKAADFRAMDQNGVEVSLKEMRKKGPVVVLFYRGHWCPYCNRALKRFQDSLKVLQKAGAQLVAVTAEGSEGIRNTVSKNGITFPIIFDEDMKLAKSYGVYYKVDDRTIGRYKNAGFDLAKINVQKEVALPVPAVYVVNEDGAVSYRYFNEDYRRRPWVSDIIAALK